MTHEGIYTLAELAQATGVPPRNIRFYTTEGVLPPPIRGRFAMYGPSHLHRLRLIRALKRALVPLVLMRRHLPRLSDAQVLALLDTLPPEPGVEPTAETTAETAVDSPRETTPDAEAANAKATARIGEVATLLLAPHTQDVSAEDTPEPALSEASALAYKTIAGVLVARPQDPATGTGAPTISTDIPINARRALLVSPLLATETREMEATTVTASDKQAPPPLSAVGQPTTDTQTWQRMLLAPGVELHVRVPETDAERAELERVIADARALFAK